MQRIKSLVVFYFVLVLSGLNVFGGVVPKSKSFSGKVFLITLGVNDYSRVENFQSLRFCESDAKNFQERLKRDSSIAEVVAFNFTDKHTKNNVLAAFDEIAKTAGPTDALIFYCAAMSWTGKIYLADGTTINATELFTRSQNVYASKQLFYLDACHGEDFTGDLKQKLMRYPEESAIANLNRVVLSVNGLAYETPEGGAFTNAYVKNQTIRIMDIFSNSGRLETRVMDELYTSLEKFSPNMSIDHFSEKEFYTTIIASSSDSRSTITGNPSDSKPETKKILIRKGETLSLIIGCKNFENFRRLDNTLNDAKELKDMLEQKYWHKTLYLEDPTHSSFRKILVSIKEEYEFEPGSQFLFFAATHGAKDENGSGIMIFKDSYKDGPFFEKTYSLNSIKKAISLLDATNTLMLIDICHAGTMFDDGTCNKPGAIEIPLSSPIFTSKGTGSPAFTNFLNQETNLFIGSATDQEAADGRTNHSPFATVLLNFLSKNNLPIIDSYQLQQSIQNNVMKEGAISLPMFCTYACKDDGRFLFIQR